MNQTISVLLTANTTSFSTAMARAAAQTRTFSQSVEGTAKRSSTAWSTVGKGATVAGVAIAAGIGVAVKAAADFEVKMSSLQAVTGASANSLMGLRDQAIAMGAATAFSASEAAQAQIELAKAGVATSDILGGALQGSLALAAAGELEVAEAATVASQAMVTFGLSGKDVPAIADALAAGANKSAAEVHDLSMGLSQSGLVANQFGLSMEETVGTLSAFSAAGLQGSDAGTSLKTMLLRLGAPTSKASELMSELGINVYDAQGSMLPFASIAEILQNSLQGMSESQRNAAMSTLFGSDAIRAANVVFREGGEGIAEWTDSVSEQGYAADLAATKTDNLMGDVERLGGSFQTLLIQLGESGQGPARAAVQFLTGLADGVAGLPAPVMQAGVAIGALAAGALILGGTAPKLAAANAALGAMGPAGAAAAGGISLMSRALQGAALAAPVILGLNFAIDKLFDSTAGSKELEDLARQLDLFGGASERAQGILLDGDIGGEFDKLAGAIGRVTEPSNLERLSDIGGEITSFGGLISQSGSDLSDAHQDIEDFNNALIELAESDPQAAGEAYAQALQMMIDRGVPAREAMEQLGDARRAVFEGGVSAGGTAGAIEEVGTAAEVAEQQVSDFKDTLESLFLDTLGVQAATDAVAQSINDLSTQFIENGGAIRGNSNEALANREALRGVVEAQLDSLGVMADAGASQEELAFATGAAISQLRGLAERFPQLAPVIQDYIATLEGVPASVATTVDADPTRAHENLNNAEGHLAAWNASRGTATADANNDSARVRIQSSRDSLHSWDTSSGTAAVNADDRSAASTQAFARDRLAAWDRSSGSASVNATDNASGTISKVARNLSALDGRTATVTITNREIRQQITEVGTRPMRMPVSRWGNVTDAGGQIVKAQSGYWWDQAGVATQPTMFWGERATGGEAYIPRLGNRDRSLDILAQAADWYGMGVVPKDAIAAQAGHVFGAGMTGGADLRSGFGDVAQAVWDSTNHQIRADAVHHHHLVGWLGTNVKRYLDWTTNGIETLIKQNAWGARNVRWFEDLASIHKLQNFDTGGVVAGRIGQPQLVVAHGGETISPPGRATTMGVDNSIHMPVHVNVKVTAGDIVDGGQQLERRITSGVNNGINAAMRELIRQQRKRPGR